MKEQDHPLREPALQRLRRPFARLAVRAASAILRRGLQTRHLPGDVALGALVTGAESVSFEGGNDIGTGTSFDHEVTVGHGTTIGMRCVVQGPVTIGNYCQLAPHVLVYGQDHPVHHFSTYTGKRLLQGRLSAFHVRTPITIGNGVWIGCNAVVLRGSDIGNGAVVGAGAVVRGVIPAYSIVVGNPARIIGERVPADIAALIEQTEWWTLSDERMQLLQDVADVDIKDDPNRAKELLVRALERLEGTAIERHFTT
jgi:virginiamycin A acetyltransferase